MSLDHLWAGWRSGYVASVPESNARASDAGAPGSSTSVIEGDDDPAVCVFCRILASGAPDEDRHVVHVGSTTVAMLNAYPYASGHLLVMPKRHVRELSALEGPESTELWEATLLAARAIESAYGPDGLNIGANLGRAAGAGIPRHLHLHVVPRWIGDTNFMTTVASVRVLPEALSDSWAKLRAAWPT